MLGNVDDVALEERDGRLVAVGLLRGPGAWAHRQPGALGRWGRAVWRRLDPREDPRPSCSRSTTCSRSARPCTSTRGPTPSSPAPTASSCGSARHVVAQDPRRPRRRPPLRRRRWPHGPGQDADLDLRRHGAPAQHPARRPGRAGGRVGCRTGASRCARCRSRRCTSRVGPLVVTSLVHGPPTARRRARATARTRGWAPGPRGGAAVVAPGRRRDALGRRRRRRLGHPEGAARPRRSWQQALRHGNAGARTRTPSLGRGQPAGPRRSGGLPGLRRVRAGTPPSGRRRPGGATPVGLLGRGLLDALGGGRPVRPHVLDALARGALDGLHGLLRLRPKTVSLAITFAIRCRVRLLSSSSL